MDTLKKANDGNLLENEFNSETTSISSVDSGFPALDIVNGKIVETDTLHKPTLSADPRINGHLGNHSSSMDIPSEYRDFSNLDDELQSLNDGIDQFIRCRSKGSKALSPDGVVNPPLLEVNPKDIKVYPGISDAGSPKSSYSALNAGSTKSPSYPVGSTKSDDAVPVELAREAAEIKVDKAYPPPVPEGLGPAPGLTIKSQMFDEDKLKKAFNEKIDEGHDIFAFFNSNRLRITVFVLVTLVSFFGPIPLFLRGIIVGAYMSAVVSRFVYYMRHPSEEPVTHHWPERASSAELVPKKDLLKTDKVLYTGWMNLLAGNYDPTKYHTKLTQSVLLHLDRDVLRLYFPKKGVKKHTIWNEKKIEAKFISQEMYNITGASVCIQPMDLAPRRWWSRKYPIRITFDNNAVAALPDETQSDTGIVISQHEVRDPSDVSDSESDEFGDSDTQSMDQKLINGRRISPSDLPERSQIKTVIDSVKDAASRKTIYLFARSTREKEQWFHQLRKAADQYYYKTTCDETHAALSHGTDRDKVIDIDQKALDWIMYSSLQGIFEKTMDTLIKQKIEPKDVVSMDLGVQMWKPIDRVTAEVAVNHQDIAWANALVGRIFMDFSKDPFWLQKIKERVERKMASVHLPHFIESLQLKSLELGENVPHITSVYEPTINEWGLWVDMNIEYTGGIHCLIETKVNLMKLKTDAAEAVKPRGKDVTTYDDEAIPESPESLSASDEEDQPNLPEKPKKSKGKKILNMLDKVAQSKVFQTLTDTKLAKKAMQSISDTPINLIVDVVYLEGTFVVNIPTPPSERLWYGFRCPPKVQLKCKPKVGDTPVNLTHVMDWIETKVCFLLEKFLVVPNLDDLVIPLLSGGSPLLKDIYE